LKVNAPHGALGEARRSMEAAAEHPRRRSGGGKKTAAGARACRRRGRASALAGAPSHRILCLWLRILRLRPNIDGEALAGWRDADGEARAESRGIDDEARVE
jgi:hypothetical protein